MEQARRPGEGNTVAQLKDDIDSGRTGSKTPTADPGLSPLGTDDEAAGRPTSPARVAEARTEEKRIGRIATSADKPANNGSIKIMVAAIAVIAIVIVVAFVLFR